MSDADRRRTWLTAFVCLIIGIVLLTAPVAGVDHIGFLPPGEGEPEIRTTDNPGAEAIFTIAGIVSLLTSLGLFIWLHKDGQGRGSRD